MPQRKIYKQKVCEKKSSNKLFVAFLTLFLFSNLLVHSTIQDKLIFSEDLNSLARKTDANLIADNKDETRATVAQFTPAKNSLDLPSVARDSSLTLAFWFRPKNIDIHSGTFIGEDSVFYFRYLSNRKIQFNHYLKKDINTSSLLSDKEWQHIAFSLNPNGRLCIYFNGDSILGDTISNTWWKKKGLFSIGQDRYGINAEGSIDELKIWNHTLSSNEIELVYEDSKLKPSLDYKLLSYLPLAGDYSDISVRKTKLEATESILFISDSTRNLVADFSKETSVIKTSGFSFDNQMTICLWAKPTSSKWLMALVGNPDFSFRYITDSKQLFFSVPMLFGCKSKAYSGVVDDWIHMAIAINYNHKANFYINGELIDCQPILGKTGKEDYLMIGQSIWGDTFDGQLSNFAIWNRVLAADEIKEVYQGKLDLVLVQKQANSIPVILWILLISLSILILYIFWRLRLKGNALKQIQNEKKRVDELPTKNAVCLLEPFRAYNKDGVDISHDFSPTLIKLFALILLYPNIYKRKITSQELSDILWESDNTTQQKNNRGTNIHRLRTLFNQFKGFNLVYQNKEWVIENHQFVYIDVWDFEEQLKKGNYNTHLNSLLYCKALRSKNIDSIVQLSTEHHLKMLENCCAELFSRKEWISLEKLATLWLSVDPLHEKALQLLLTSLIKNNQKQKAFDAYNRFSVNYKSMLNEELQLSFEDCIL